MATFIPALNQLDGHLNASEMRVARFLQHHLDDDCIVWCNIPTGKRQLYADFLILMPQKGLLCLEVKDWSLKTIGKISKYDCLLNINGVSTYIKNPLIQARDYILNVVQLLQNDPQLQQTGEHQGRLILPYAHGVVFTHFSHGEMRQIMGDAVDDFYAVCPLNHTMFKDDLGTNKASSALARLSAMFEQKFPCQLNQIQIDRIRWHLFPEIRINSMVQGSLFDDETQVQEIADSRLPEAPKIPLIKPIEQIPDIIKVMDMQQELTARMMGGGHRVIHGVAGSGKTLILGLRAQVLAERTEKPILVLCYNITLAAKLRSLISDKGLSEKVQVHHFHGWCKDLVKQHQIELTAQEQSLLYDGAVQAALRAAENGLIPLEQYGAVLIDEGHDFEADWLRLAVKMLDKSENHLLLLYDDAQSIYPNQRQQKGIPFTLSSVGIQARGRTVKLSNNYRNTKQIIGLAHIFAQQYLQEKAQDDDSISIVEPCAVGADGEKPHLQHCENWQGELAYLERCLKKWQERGVPLQEIAIICPTKEHCADVSLVLDKLDLPYWALHKPNQRHKYDPKQPKVTLIPIPSSKGLEFQRVILMGVADLGNQRKNSRDPIRLIYVAMTRAQSYLLITLSGSNEISTHIQSSLQQWQSFQAA